MKMNKQTVEYINSLVEEKSKKKLAELVAKRDAITKKEEAVLNAAKSDVNKALAEAAKKIEAIYRKHGITPMSWCNEATKVGVNVCDQVRSLRSEFADELRDANNAINSFGSTVYKKQPKSSPSFRSAARRRTSTKSSAQSSSEYNTSSTKRKEVK